MPVSYSLFHLERFPNSMPPNRPYAPPVQSPLPLAGISEEPPKTELSFLGTITALNIGVYRILHEFISKSVGRVQGVRFTQFIEERQFSAYVYNPEQLLMLKVNKDVASSAVKALNRGSDFKARRREVDLQSIAPQIERLKGAWWRINDGAHVTSQAIFGPSIDRDLRFERASSEGGMIHVRLDHIFNGTIVHVGISEDSTVLVFDNTLDEYSEIELVLELKRTLLDIAQEAY